MDPLRTGRLFDPNSHRERREEKPKKAGAARRAVLQEVASELLRLEARMASVQLRISTSQAQVHAVAPATIVWQEPGSAATREVGKPSYGLHHGRAYEQLEGLSRAMARVNQNNQRLMTVVELMLASLELMEPVTQLLADGFLRVHIRQTQEMLTQVERALVDFPRTHSFAGAALPRLS